MKRGMFLLFVLGIIISLGSVSAEFYVNGQSADFDVKYSTEKFAFSVNEDFVLRVSQSGEPFADVDAIRVRACGKEILPNKAEIAEKNVLEDILEIDNNVVVVSDVLEVSYDVGSCKFAEVYLTANEYGHASPFNFDGIYKIGSSFGRLSLTSKNYCPVPLYSLYWEPSTGHPKGYTYVYVSEDSEKIYFSVDVTPDNTEEYGEDWTEIKIGGEIFRIDDFSDKYGKCSFGLTDKVNYKHQICEFEIPKDEINLEEEIDFNFKYYGTAGGAWDYITACQVINVSGSYTVTADLSAAGSCININVSNVYLDCDGYEIVYGTGGANGVNGINITPKSAKAENYTIMNCNVKKGSNTGTNGYGISLLVADDSIVRDNNVSVNGTDDSYGIYITQSRNVSVFRNKVSTNGSDGGTYGGIGIYNYLSNSTNISENKIYSAGHGLDIGIAVESSIGVNITDNNIFTNGEITKTGSDEYGIYIYLSNYSWILNNNITTNGTTNDAGIFLDDGAHNNVSFNTINASGNGANNHGIRFRGDSIHNVIVGNNISTQGTTNNNAFIFSIFGTTQHPEGNNITGNAIGFIKGFSVNFSSASINHTFFTDQYLENYSFEGDGEVVYFKDSSYGEIRFSEPVTGMGANLSSDIKIANNSIAVNSAGNTGLNKSANVTLYGIYTDYKMPLITRDNKLCPATSVCTNITALTAGSVSFNVTSFNNFSIDSYPETNAISPRVTTYTGSSSVVIDVNLNEVGSCKYSLDGGVTNNSLTANSSNTGFSATRTFSNGAYVFNAYCNDSIQLMNNSIYFNFTFNVASSVDSTPSGGGPSRTTTTTPTEVEEETEEACEPNVVCGEWSSCGYLDDFGSIASGEVSLSGSESRICSDKNGCGESYTERRSCETIKKVDVSLSIEKDLEMKEDILIGKDILTDNPIFEINVDALREGRLEISFVQSEDMYANHCYNSKMDGDETGIDCGGMCKACFVPGGVVNDVKYIYYKFPLWSIWLLILVLIGSIVYLKKERVL